MATKETAAKEVIVTEGMSFTEAFQPVTARDMFTVLHALKITTHAEFEARLAEVQRKVSALVTKRLLAVREHIKENEK